MVCIKLDQHKDLRVTTASPVYQGENAQDTLTFLVPKSIPPIEDLKAAMIYLTYIRPDGVADMIWLTHGEEYGDDYYQYNVPYNTKFTRVPGEICMWLQIYDGVPSNPTILKSSEVMIYVHKSKNVNEYIDDSNLTLLYEIHKELVDKDEELSARIDKKADNIIYNEEDSTIQLTADGEPIGDRVFVHAKNGALISDMFISKNGNLWVIYDNQTSENLGRVVGDDGKVYMPKIDEHKILTFTVEDAPSDKPIPPTDLNPFDEWSPIEDDGLMTDYIWEGL